MEKLRRFLLFLLRGTAALWLLWAPSIAQAIEHAPSASVRFAEAIAQIEQAPSIRAAREGLQKKQAMDRTLSRMTANPQLYLQLGYRREGETVQGVEAQLGLQQQFSLSGYARRRAQAAAHEEAALQSEIGWLLFTRRLAVARTWLLLWGIGESLRAAEDEVKAMTELVQRVERATFALSLTQVDLAEARTYRSEAQLQVISLEGDEFDQGTELARLLAHPEPLFLHAEGPPPELPLPEPRDELRQRLLALAPGLPEPQTRRRFAEAERAREAEAHAQRGTQLTLGIVGLREPLPTYSLLGTFGLSLPFFERGQRERAELLARAARLAGEAEEATTAARAELLTALHDVTHTGEVAQEVSENTLPAAEQALKLRERLLSQGEGTMLEVLLARRSYAAARGRKARALAAHAFARYRLLQYVEALSMNQTSQTSKTSSTSSIGRRPAQP